MGESSVESDEAGTQQTQYALQVANVLPFWAAMVAVGRYLLRRWGLR